MGTGEPGTFGALLRRYRHAAALSQEALAERAGLSAVAISALERGVRRAPHLNTVDALATALALDAADRAALLAAVPRPGPPQPAAEVASAGDEQADRPPPIPGPRAPAPRHNLPAALTGLVGREAALDEVVARLGEARLVTLTGTGGCGKTRLALAVAEAALPAYSDGAWLVELAALTDPGVVPGAVAHVLGVPETAGQPLPVTLLAALRDRRLLLVLDNCEHVLDACTRLADDLLRACPGLRLLATSREALGIAGEVSWRVPSLAAPPPGAPAEAVAASAAGRLFVERARAAQPDFRLTGDNAAAVAEICWRLDGIPLALELAAARARTLPVEQIAARLDDRFRLLTGGGRAAAARHRTLRAAIAWSDALLTEPERALLRRLSVFAGGWSLDAAEAVGAGDGIAGWEVLDLLARLVEQSLVQLEPGAGPEARYRPLETVRQYAAERLAEAGEEAATRGRHAAWAAALAEQAGPGLLARDQLGWLARLDVEHDNLRAALAWGLAHAPAVGLRLAGRLWPFWRMRAHYSEGTRWLTAVLAGGREPAPDWARAALGAGILARDMGEMTTARARLEASLACSRALGERALAAWALRDLGQLHVQLGEFGAGEALLEEGLALARAAGDERGAAAALMILAQAVAFGGDLGRARALNEEGLAAARLTGDRWLISTILMQLGIVAVDQGDLEAAPPLLEEGLVVAREVGMVLRSGQLQFQLGRVALAQGNLERAVALLEGFRSAARARNSPEEMATAAGELARAAHLRGEPAAAATLMREALHHWQALGNRLRIVECLEAAAAMAATAPSRAARLLGAAGAARRALGAPPPPIRRPDLATTERAARAALGDVAFEAAWVAGEALPLEQAVAEALAAAEIPLRTPPTRC
jgi:non-specific serine/threonine protein kinase